MGKPPPAAKTAMGSVPSAHFPVGAAPAPDWNRRRRMPQACTAESEPTAERSGTGGRANGCSIDIRSGAPAARRRPERRQTPILCLSEMVDDVDISFHCVVLRPARNHPRWRPAVAERTDERVADPEGRDAPLFPFAQAVGCEVEKQWRSKWYTELLCLLAGIGSMSSSVRRVDWKFAVWDESAVTPR